MLDGSSSHADTVTMRPRWLGLAALPLLPLACFGSDGKNGGGATIDAGFDGTSFEASGDDSSSDGPATNDGPVDAMAEAVADVQLDVPVDSPPQPVTMTVVTPTGPKQGITVVFEDATGTVLATVVTDATGKASHVVPAGSQVTVLIGSPTSPQITTIAGVAPGDMLTALDTTSAAAPTVSLDAVPTWTADAGAANYAVYAGASCWNTFMTPPVTFTLSTACQQAGKFPLLVIAQNATFLPVGFTYQKGNSITTDDAGIAHASLAGGTWTTTAPLTQTVQTSNSSGTLSGAIGFSEIAGGVPLQTSSFLPSPDDAGAQGSAYIVHPGYADAVQAEVNVLTIVSGASLAAIATQSAPPTTSGTTSLDVSTLLPSITNATVDSTTPAQPGMSWTSASSLASTAGFIVQIGWTASTDAGTVSGTWTIYAPPSATSVKAPALPSSATGWAPPTGASFAFPTLAAVKATFLPGYDAFRAQTSSFPMPNVYQTGVAIVPTLPAMGTLWLTTYGPNPS